LSLFFRHRVVPRNVANSNRQCVRAEKEGDIMRSLEEGTLCLLVAPLSARAFLPHKAHPTDAGFDLAIPTDHTLGAQEWARIDLEIVVQLPTGWYGQVLGRSSVFQRGLTVHPGVIDADYRGSIQLLLHNQTHTTQVLQRGDRLAQLLLLPVPQVSVSLVTLEALSPTARGAGGLGSTGL
jgi:dUTP pyrophosphatase